jgi:hypothetical protein
MLKIKKVWARHLLAKASKGLEGLKPKDFIISKIYLLRLSTRATRALAEDGAPDY